MDSKFKFKLLLLICVVDINSSLSTSSSCLSSSDVLFSSEKFEFNFIVFAILYPPFNWTTVCCTENKQKQIVKSKYVINFKIKFLWSAIYVF